MTRAKTEDLWHLMRDSDILCDQWKDMDSFMSFMKDAGPHTTLRRPDVRRPMGPDNVVMMNCDRGDRFFLDCTIPKSNPAYCQFRDLMDSVAGNTWISYAEEGKTVELSIKGVVFASFTRLGDGILVRMRKRPDMPGYDIVEEEGSFSLKIDRFSDVRGLENALMESCESADASVDDDDWFGSE